jgi:hypothetical protein
MSVFMFDRDSTELDPFLWNSIVFSNSLFPYFPILGVEEKEKDFVLLIGKH